MPNAILDQEVRELWVSDPANALVNQVVREVWAPVLKLVGIQVIPINSYTLVNGQMQFSAVGVYDSGFTSPLSGVTWSSSSTNIATITPLGGLATGLVRGGTTITATLGLLSGTTNFYVTGAFRSDRWCSQSTGQSIPNAEVYVLGQPATVPTGISSQGPAPSPLASIYRDINRIVPLTQPIKTDAFGHYAFYVLPDQLYTIAEYIRVNDDSAKLFHEYPDQSIGQIG